MRRLILPPSGRPLGAGRRISLPLPTLLLLLLPGVVASCRTLHLLLPLLLLL